MPVPYFTPQEKQGEVKHVFRGCVFIQARNVLENAGIIVCKAKHVELAGGTSTAIQFGGNSMIPKSPRLHSPAPHRGQGTLSFLNLGVFNTYVQVVVQVVGGGVVEARVGVTLPSLVRLSVLPRALTRVT